MQVEFGIWDHFENRRDVPVEQQYAEKIALLREAERLGFSGYHVAEHHLTPLDLAPSPNVFLAALAQATSRLRIGTMVHILPLYHPVRLVQELCMLDHLSSGRLDIGVGRGARSVEHEWFGVDPAESRARSEEILAILVSAMSSGNLAYDGRFYQIPDAPLDLLPRQRPYPPLWYAGGAEFAGRNGLNFLGRSAESVARYWELWQETSRRSDRLNPHVTVPKAGITKHIIVRETDEEARAIGRRAWAAFGRNWVATSLRTPDGQVVPPQREDFDAVLAESARLLIGSPKTIREYLAGVVEDLEDRPALYFAPALQWGDITHEEALESLRLFAGQVMPAFQPAIAHRAY
jgi:alkanesulfonate monooxygenase SsuD/methylene tetrahydromethanopterin reductase-like flavin-dependent oxidoreductase (luciferase family)